MKVLLILVDGMRADALGGIEKAQEFMKKSAYTLDAKTVMPSVTLPCHMSLFHSVDPLRHGTTTNTYAPQVRPIKSLCNTLTAAGKKCAFFYNWEQLRDLYRPGGVAFSYFASGKAHGYDKSNTMLTDEAIKYLGENDIDFTFLYLGDVDEVGHKFGWMTDEYFESIRKSFDQIDKIVNTLPEDYTVFIIADHGGHDRTHGTEMPEDMTIPVFALGKDFKAGEILEGVSIKDIAPTVTNLLGVEKDEDWEGKYLF